ncbi:hypothetical protein [Streptomyces mirabilis]|uniref:hypothetical protein n=1 Tax=Streptomyces mirabilis TaxID=68239 RepID=UPI00367EBCDD
MTKPWQQLTDERLREALSEQFGGAWVAWQSKKAPFERAVAQLTRGTSGRLVVSGLLILDPAITTDRLKSIPVRAIEDEANRSQAKRVTELPPLTREGRSAEEFAQLVADHYQAHSAVVANPVAAMAAAAGVKSPTVHTWVREARLRGLLPPASRRKS